MLRLLYADQGRKRDLLQAVSSAHGWAREEAERGLAQLEGYREEGGPFPERLHIIVVFADLYVRLIEAVEGWATAARTEIAAWPRTGNLGATPATVEHLESLIDRARKVLGGIDSDT